MYEQTVEAGEWKKLVEPIVKKCRLAASLDMVTKFNTDGSLALAQLLERMAEILDGDET